MKLLFAVFAMLVAFLLSGCREEPAAFLINGSTHSMTIERSKPYFWSDGWELEIIIRHHPDCQRRYPLQKAGERVRIDLYQPDPNIFILHQNKHWYVTETSTCRMQQYEEAPPEPGEFVGSFRVRGGVFRFVPAAEIQQ